VNDAPAEREGDSAWARLRRRKVVQWGVAYVAASWGLHDVPDSRASEMLRLQGRLTVSWSEPLGLNRVAAMPEKQP
jgi:hypothetical protein